MIHAPPCCVCGSTVGVDPEDEGTLATWAAQELIPCQLLSRSIGRPCYICARCTREAVTQYAILNQEILKRKKGKR